MKEKSIKGITLVALVITIVILLILAGISIQAITNTGLFANAKRAAEESKYANAEEKVKMAVMASYDENGKLSNELLKENLNKIEGLSEKIVQIKYDLKIIVNDYIFKIEEDGKVTKIDENQEEDKEEPGTVLSYNFKNNSKNVDTEIITGIYDTTENDNQANIYSTKLNEKNNGFIFDGSTTFAQVNLKQNLTFPITIEMTILPQGKNISNQIIFMEPKLKIGLQIYGSNFYTTVNYNTKGFKIPSDFYDDTNKHIVITYESLDKIQMYINGKELANNSENNSNNTNTGDIFYLGRRQGGAYFKGVLYNFRIYNRKIQGSEILESYNSDKIYIENGTNKINRHDEILEYDIRNEQNLKKEKMLQTAKDKTDNQNDALFNIAEYSENMNGVIFDGSTTFAQVNLKQNLTFPITIEMAILPQGKEISNQVIFMEPKLKIGLQIYESNFYTTVNYDTKGFKIPSDFYDGTNKHIVITYESLDKIQMYVNGKELANTDGNNSNNSKTGDIFYLGRRQGGAYFKGIMYGFKIICNK